MILYHYTCTTHLPKILKAGYLKTTESNVSMRFTHKGPDVVWLTDTPTADLGHGVTTIHEGHSDGTLTKVDGSSVPRFDKTRVRFTVDVDATRWLDWEPAGHMTKAWRRILIANGGGQEAAGHWYVFEGRIPESDWTGVSVDGVDHGE